MLIGACILPDSRLIDRKARSKKPNCFRKLKPKGNKIAKHTDLVGLWEVLAVLYRTAF